MAGVLASFRPDVVIGSSLLRLAWTKIRALCEAQSIPTVLYIREVEAFNHFEGTNHPADGVVANAASLARHIEALGFRCDVFPSVIEVDVTQVDSTRQVALVINPIESRGIGTIWKLAEAVPGVHFVAQESWPLTDDQRASLERHLALAPNVEFRPAEAPGPRLYRDARVLLVPYRVDNRPRVIAEAQANGIPVIVADSPALVEAAEHGGIAVPADDVAAWCAAVNALWDDDDLYQALSSQSLEHSQRDDISAAKIAHLFERYLKGLIEQTP